LRDAKLYEIGAGTSEIRRMLIGRELFNALNRDLEMLQSVRDQLAAMPEPDGFQEMVRRAMERFPEADPPAWPPELARVDRYIRCFDYPYAIAYEGEC
jgi:hypothetical protein